MKMYPLNPSKSSSPSVDKPVLEEEFECEGARTIRVGAAEHELQSFHHPRYSHAGIIKRSNNVCSGDASTMSEGSRDDSLEMSYTGSNRGVTKSYQQGHIIGEPTAQDVLFGRGRPFINHNGNIRMRNIVEGYKERYEKAGKHEKTVITEEVLNVIKAGGGRFLRVKQKSTKNQVSWMEVSAKEAHMKVGHRLREDRFKSKGGQAPQLYSVSKKKVRQEEAAARGSDVSALTLRPTGSSVDSDASIGQASSGQIIIAGEGNECIKPTQHLVQATFARQDNNMFSVHDGPRMDFFLWSSIFDEDGHPADDDDDSPSLAVVGL
jgi:hypothetical protein